MIYRILVLVLIGVIVGYTTEYHVDKEKPREVKFISDAPVEKIEGITDKVDGYVLLQSEALTGDNEFYFEVDLNSIDTGIGLRNRHMRENYLHTDKYPYASYAGKITTATPTDSSAINVETTGTFELHGVKKQVQIDGQIFPTDNGYKASAQFEVKLEDYNIERPQLMLLKIGEVMQLQIEFYVIQISTEGK